ncbi:hypothetical protein Hanom_Chr01g00039071 [Helianthus anomalus]
MDSKGFSSATPPCMGINQSVEIPQVPIYVHEEVGLGDHNSAEVLLEERECNKGVGSAGYNNGPCSDPIVGVGDGGPSDEIPRPSYVTLRTKKSKAQKKGPVNAFKTPDLNNSVEVNIDSDPFNIEEIFRLETENNKGAVESNGRSISGNPELEEQVSALSSSEMEKEVAETMKVGVALGIEVSSFDNHLRKIVNGESVQVGCQ